MGVPYYKYRITQNHIPNIKAPTLATFQSVVASSAMPRAPCLCRTEKVPKHIGLFRHLALSLPEYVAQCADCATYLYSAFLRNPPALDTQSHRNRKLL